MLTVAGRGGKICQNLAEVICERSLTINSLLSLFRIVCIIIPVCSIKQPNGTLSRMYVQTYFMVK